MALVSVVTYQSRFLPAFVALNREWIEHYFRLEEMDLHQLEKPHASILDVGGEIFFVLEGEVPLGTVAMVPHGPGNYELAKMAVSPDARGKGYGDLLMRTAVGWARERGAQKVTILSNTVLTPAISLYKKHGFRTIYLGKHPDYERCNIEMELILFDIR